MAEKFSFFDPVLTEAGIYDREYNAQEFTDYFKTLITTGVMKSEGSQLKVSTNGTNMKSSIADGIAYILGRRYANDDIKEHMHDTETLGNNRIDRIVIRMDLNPDNRHVLSFIKKGAPSPNPVPPALTQNNNIYEISLAQVTIVGGQTFIASNAVKDERGTAVICPWAGSNILPSYDDNALQILQESFNSHVNNQQIHVTQAKQDLWNKKEFVSIVDGRAINAGAKSPKECLERLGHGITHEFIDAHSINTVLFQPSTWAVLETYKPWVDSSGGYPIQKILIASSGRTYYRIGLNDTTWSNLKEDIVLDHTRPMGVDLNNYTQPGFYALGDNLIHGPEDGSVEWGSLIVTVSGDVINQIIMNFQGYMYMRGKSQTQYWTTWRCIAHPGYDLTSIFTSVSNGKATVNQAVTDKGVYTAPDATFATTAANIRAIQTYAHQFYSFAQSVPQTNYSYEFERVITWDRPIKHAAINVPFFDAFTSLGDAKGGGTFILDASVPNSYAGTNAFSVGQNIIVQVRPIKVSSGQSSTISGNTLYLKITLYSNVNVKAQNLFYSVYLWG